MQGYAVDQFQNDSKFFSESKQCMNSNEDDQKWMMIFDHLERACKLAQSFPDDQERKSACNFLESRQKKLQAQYIAKNYDGCNEIAEELYENLSEALAECNDIKIRNKIASQICKMMDYFDTDNT